MYKHYLLNNIIPPSTCNPTITLTTFIHPSACRKVSALLTTSTTPHCACAVVGKFGPCAKIVEQYCPFQFVGCHWHSLQGDGPGCWDVEIGTQPEEEGGQYEDVGDQDEAGWGAQEEGAGAHVEGAGAQEETGSQLLQSQPAGQQATLLLAQVQ